MTTANPQYVIRDLFPSKQIHLIFGPAHSGKTTLMMQIMDDWRNGRDVFGYHSHPAPYCYASCTKQLPDVESHMRRIGLDPATIPHLSLQNTSSSREDFNIETLILKAKSLVPDLRVLWLEGLGTICPGKITEVRDVTEFLRNLMSICRREHLTIIAEMTTVKAREGNSYSYAIDRLPGSNVWSDMTGSKIPIDLADPRDLTDINRIVVLVMRNRASRRLYAAFVDSGLLAITDRLEVATMDSWLTQQPTPTQVTTKEIHKVGKSLGVSRSSITRWITDQHELGTLNPVSRGVWQIPERATA
jgi:hypothetical protein